MPWTRLRPAAGALAAAVLLAAPVARAESAVSCHCYRDRTFDLERPAAADPYILATVRSSLLSAAYGVPKSDLVRTAMSGTSADTLWIAHVAAARSGRHPPVVLLDREQQGSWKAVLARAPGLGKPLEAALAAGAPDAALAVLVVDEVFVERLGADAGAVKAFRAEGASSEETVLAVVLARKLRGAELALAPAPARRRDHLGVHPHGRGAHALRTFNSVRSTPCLGERKPAYGRGFPAGLRPSSTFLRPGPLVRNLLPPLERSGTPGFSDLFPLPVVETVR